MLGPWRKAILFSMSKIRNLNQLRKNSGLEREEVSLAMVLNLLKEMVESGIVQDSSTTSTLECIDVLEKCELIKVYNKNTSGELYELTFKGRELLYFVNTDIEIATYCAAAFKLDGKKLQDFVNNNYPPLNFLDTKSVESCYEQARKLRVND